MPLTFVTSLNKKYVFFSTIFLCVYEDFFIKGVGLSVHGMFRVATEKTLFSMPETALGNIIIIASE